jgi:DNA-binding NarL/FixJ family response regulator
VVLIPQALTGAIDGIEATRRLREVFPKAKVVLLMATSSAENLYSALQAAVSAILPIDMPMAQIVPVLAQVHAEDICWIEPRLARLLPSLFSAQSGVSSGSKSSKKTSFAVTVPSKETFADSDNPVVLAEAFSSTTNPSGPLHQKRFASNPTNTVATNPTLASEVQRRVSQDASSSVHGLTGREVDVLKLITEGRTNQDIARHLVITQNTVKTHMKNIFQKLGVSDRTGAAVKALRENLLA